MCVCIDSFECVPPPFLCLNLHFVCVVLLSFVVHAGYPLGISDTAVQSLSTLTGKEFVQLSKDDLRHQLGLHEADVAKVASLIFQVADPRAQNSME